MLVCRLRTYGENAAKRMAVRHKVFMWGSKPSTLVFPVGFLYRSMCGSATVIFLQAHCCWIVVSHGSNIRPLSFPLEVSSRHVRIFILHMPNASPF
jgi:hypothetical protein